MKPGLSDAVELTGSVTADVVIDMLMGVVNLAWERDGENARCNVFATWLGWLLQEHLALEAKAALLAASLKKADARVEVLEAALRPFAEIANKRGLHALPSTNEWCLARVSDVEAARAALAAGGGQ